jgi:voltage-gated potassium channel
LQFTDRSQLNRTLFWLYEGAGPGPFAFRWIMLLLDLAIVAFFLLAPFQGREAHHWSDYAIGAFFALDLAARYYIARDKKRFFLDWMTWVDLLLIAACFVPILVANFAFLRVLRIIRAIRRFTFIRHKGEFWSFVTRHEKVFDRAVNFGAFIFITSGLVYATQVGANTNIDSYLDALYFTVTSLTTTGYGDITLAGPGGRWLSIFIMLLGLTLFLRMLSAIFNAAGNVRRDCDTCGLDNHEADAVHCRRCGAILKLDEAKAGDRS